jgi:hypothetical protein
MGLIKVSLDFDGTLGHKAYIQEMAKDLMLDSNVEVHIITRRYGYVDVVAGDEMSEVFRIAHILKIPKERVHFLNREYKYKLIKELGIKMHWDDDMLEIVQIRTHVPECLAFKVRGQRH